MNLLRRELWKLRLKAKGKSLAKLNSLRYAQKLSREKTKELQEQRLQALLQHAYYHVPYYRSLLHEHKVVEGEGKVQLEQFSKLPLLDKPILRENWQKLQSDDLEQRKWWENTSGGSTGEPGRFIQDQTYKDWSTAVKLLFDEWTGCSLGDKKVLLWGSERDLLVGKETFRTMLGRQIRGEVALNSFSMSPEKMRTYIKTINHFKPKQILAYAESIYELARFAESEKLEVYSPTAVMTSAGTLHAYMREQVERVLQTEVFNRYGSREVGDIACEDRHHKGLLVSVPTHYVELLRADGSPAQVGEAGEVVVTLLTNFAMPLIRYRIGDVAVWQNEETLAPQSCAWSTLQDVTGRVSDYFTLQDGSKVRIPAAFFAQEEHVQKYQIVQERVDKVRVLIIFSDEGNPKKLEIAKHNIEAKLRQILKSCEITFEEVSDIPPSASGKYRYTISKVTENVPIG